MIKLRRYFIDSGLSVLCSARLRFALIGSAALCSAAFTSLLRNVARLFIESGASGLGCARLSYAQLCSAGLCWASLCTPLTGNVSGYFIVARSTSLLRSALLCLAMLRFALLGFVHPFGNAA